MAAMDKPPARVRSKFLKFLPKEDPSRIRFHNPMFSPGRLEHMATGKPKQYPRSGVSMISPGVRRRNSGGFENQEPTSPKISCMGQIKNKHNKKKKKKEEAASVVDKSPTVTHKPNVLKRIFGGRRGDGGGGDGGGTKPTFRKSKSDLSAAPVSSSRLSPTNKVPTLSQMKRFSSGRNTLAGFDWTAHLTTEKVDNRRRKFNRDYNSDEERERGEASDEEDGEPMIPFSSPLLGGGIGIGAGDGRFCLEPKKEINLWKRRTMVQPKPLQLNRYG